MHYAAYNGHLEVMKWLDWQNPRLFLRARSDGRTPLHEATRNGQLVATQWLHQREHEFRQV